MVEAICAMNNFDLAGQHLRVGRAITPPNCFEASPSAVTATLPTAAAIAAAAATAKIQAMDAMTNGNSSSKFMSQPVLASAVSGVITGVTINNAAVNAPIAIPPPSLVTSLPLSIVKSVVNSKNGNGDSSSAQSDPPATVQPTTEQSLSLAQALEQEELDKEEGQTLQQQENVIIKGSNARQVLMHKLMRKNEVKIIGCNLFL